MVEMAERAADDYERWEQQVAHTGYCAKPVRLTGKVKQVDRTTGEVRTTYDSDGEPNNTLLIACGDRRESRCPSCAARYRGDAFHIVASGLKGGKGVPESVAAHPSLFVTFTAPSFGAVHANRASGAVIYPCRPRRSGKCPHGIPRACWQRHVDGDPKVGRPLCMRCFDYQGQVLWNNRLPELWSRTPLAIRRALAELTGMTTREIEKTIKLSFAKTAEFQRRGALHFPRGHAPRRRGPSRALRPSARGVHQRHVRGGGEAGSSYGAGGVSHARWRHRTSALGRAARGAGHRGQRRDLA